MKQQLREEYGHDSLQECVEEHQQTVDDAARPEGPEQGVAETRLSVFLARLRQLLLPSPAGRRRAEKLNRNVVDVAASINFRFIASTVGRCWRMSPPSAILSPFVSFRNLSNPPSPLSSEAVSMELKFEIDKNPEIKL